MDPTTVLQPSIIDRLIDPEARGVSWRRGYGMEQMRDVVRRDLENLLNSQWVHPDLPTEYHELHQSLLRYGLPDLHSLNATTPQDRTAIAALVKGVIEHFEPRLTNVRVDLLNAREEKERR